MLADYHVHTNYSDDSTYPMEDCIKKAVSLGFDEICFTEHIDHGCQNSFCCNCEEYLNGFLKCRKKFQDRITLKFGIEFGVQAHHKKYFDEIFEKYPFDFALLSFHQIEDKELWNGDFQQGKTQAEYNRIYYEEMFKTINVFEHYSVLAHMDLMRRYDRLGEYPFEKTRDIVEEILKFLIENEKGIEVNTSSFRYNLQDLTPSTDILKLYKKLGGEIITIGSDSHRESHLGTKITYVREILKEIGYKYFTTFEKMQPIQNPL